MPEDDAFQDAKTESTDNIPFEVIVGAGAVRKILQDIGDRAQHEIATFAPGGSHSVSEIEEGRLRNLRLTERGVQSRTIYLTSVRKHHRTLEYVRWLNKRGFEVRTTPTLPIRMIIIDQLVAVLPLDTSDATTGILLHRSSSTVKALQALFETAWVNATPLGMSRTPVGRELSDEERAILELVALGKNFADIANKLGISARTIRRRVKEIEEKFQCESRSKMIYMACKSGQI